MKSVYEALTFTLFAFCFVTGEVFQKYPKNINSDEKYITVAFVLADFENKDVNLGSNVGEWLSDSFEEAATILSRTLNVQLKFQVSDILAAPRDLANEIKERTVDGQMHGPTILSAVERTYQNHINPDITCVITKGKFYENRLSNLLGFSRYTTLCENMVPILMTFNSEIEDDVHATAVLLSDLVKSSMNGDKWNSIQQKENYFNGCNIRYKLKGDGDYDEYYVLPLDKAHFYDF